MTDTDRRKYWTQSMDKAYEFMQRASKVPIEESMEKLIYLPEAADKADVDVQFSEKPHVENLPRLYYLREGLVADFIKVAAELNSRGWVMHVEDAYRTKQMQKKLATQPFIFKAVVARCKWEIQQQNVPPELLFKRMAALIASWPKVAPHMSGSALDISVYNQADSAQIERGGDYCEMSELTPMTSPFPSYQQQRNRRDITAVFVKYGFAAYPFEFWHYSNGDIFDMTVNNVAPAHYGPIVWDSQNETITPLQDLFTPLNSQQDFMELESSD